MTRILLIHAGPTQWDDEDRLVGNHPLPLTELGHQNIERVIAGLDQPVSAVFRCKKNEACDEVAKMLAAQFKLKPHDNAALDEINAGLWQGLTRNELKFRYPSVAEQWKENPLSVHPPEGESVVQAIERISSGLKRILRKGKGKTIALALRPVAMQITLGLLRGEDAATIAAHLQQSSPVETIELSDDELRRFIS
jgi:broad specificity phosphatase PhoE